MRCFSTPDIFKLTLCRYDNYKWKITNVEVSAWNRKMQACINRSSWSVSADQPIQRTTWSFVYDSNVATCLQRVTSEVASKHFNLTQCWYSQQPYWIANSDLSRFLLVSELKFRLKGTILMRQLHWNLENPKFWVLMACIIIINLIQMRLNKIELSKKNSADDFTLNRHQENTGKRPLAAVRRLVIFSWHASKHHT